MEESKKKKAGKPRIPDHLRRRTLVSCDRCKKRRIRCLRASGNEGSGDCQSCLENGVACEQTLPRKTRIYGSVESLSHRYRVLDALMKGLYPNKDTNNIDTLYAIAEAHKIALPSIEEQIVPEEVFRQSRKQSEPAPETPGLSERSLSKSPDIQPPSTAKAIEEKLVPLPFGPSHYIGPSSSFGFVLTVRRMVAEFTTLLRSIQADSERIKLASDFACSNWSKALEPIKKAENDESSDDQDSSEPGSNVRSPKKSFPFISTLKNPLDPRRSKKTPLLSLLPAREVLDAFLEAYFERVHPNYLLFHRQTFQLRYDTMWLYPGALLKHVESGWICCIFMVIVFGAQVLEDRDKAQSVRIQRHYLELVQSRMHQLLSSATLVNVQAILLLQLYQHNCTERNSAFMLLGCASRMAMALGMHREGTSGGFDETERELRKRIWWTTYMFEENQCAILGRPCAIDDTEVNVAYPNEVLLDGGYSVPHRYIEHHVLLTKISSNIRRRIYGLKAGRTELKTRLAIQFLAELDSWYQNLPSHLQLAHSSPSTIHSRAVTLLHIKFHQTQALASRPFILRKVGVELARKLGKHVRSQDLDDEEFNLSHACGTFSKNAVLLLLQLLRNGSFDGVTWLDAYYVYHGVFILSLDFLARPWDETESPEDLSRKNAVRDIMDALAKAKLCPTFTILTQVSFQLAKIVGILDPPPGPVVTPLPTQLQYIMHPQQPIYTMPLEVSDTLVSDGHPVTSWYQNKADDMPWDLREYFGVDDYVGTCDNNMFNMPHTIEGVYSTRLPGVTEDDVMVSPLPPNLAYTQWGTVTPQLHRGTDQGSTYRGGGMDQ